MKRKSYLGVMLALGILLTGCGSAGETYSTTSSMSMSSDSASLSSYSYMDYEESEYDSVADIVASNMMIVRDADVTVEVASLEAFDSYITQRVADYGGYFESQEINDYSSSYSTSRWAYYTVRVPQADLDGFLGDVEEESTITSKSISSEDVSLDYVDIKSRISALETEKDNLTRLLDQADQVSDIIEIEEQLSDVQYRLDSYNSQKLILEGRVSYSTVSIRAREDRTVAHPVASAFSVNFKEEMLDGLSSAVDTLVGIITAIPVIAIVSAFVMLFIWIWRKAWNRVFKRKGGRIRYVLTPVSEAVEESGTAEMKAPKPSISKGHNGTDQPNGGDQ